MSIRAVQVVLRAPIKPPALKLTALVLAEALNEKTRQLNPSLQTIADAVPIDRRQAQRYVQQLIALGLLSVLANAKGGPPGTTPSYLLRLDRIADMRPPERAESPPRDDTHDTPTGGADDTPTGGGTGGADDADGCHARRGRVTSKAPTGGAGVTLTWNEPGKEPGKEPGLQCTLDIATPADAGPRPAVLSKPSRSKGKTPTKTGPTWAAYSDAFRLRYGTDPVSNAKVNGMLSKLLSRISADEAPQVARFYVEHPGSYYATKLHDVSCLLTDAEKLRTEWATGKHAPERGQAEPAWRTEQRERTAAFLGPFAAKRSRQARTFEDIDYTEGTKDGRIL